MSRRRPAALASLIIRSIAQRTSVAHRMSLPGRRGTRRRRRKRKRGPPRLAARQRVEEIPLSDDALPFSGASRPVTEVIPDPVPLGIEERFVVAVLPVNVLAFRAHLAYEEEAPMAATRLHLIREAPVAGATRQRIAVIYQGMDVVSRRSLHSSCLEIHPGRRPLILLLLLDDEALAPKPSSLPPRLPPRIRPHLGQSASGVAARARAP